MVGAPDSVETLPHLWAKTEPFHPLLFHLIDVGCTAQSLITSPAFANFGKTFHDKTGCPVAEVPGWIGFLTALHDIGKCHADFQGKAEFPLRNTLREAGLIRDAPEPAFRHEAFSHQWVLDYLTDEIDWDLRPARTIAAVLRGHHGNFNSKIGSEENRKLREYWEPLRLSVAGKLKELFRISEWKPVDFPDHSASGLLLAGLTVLSDWIASNGELYPTERVTSDCSEYMLASQVKSQAAVRKLGFTDHVGWLEAADFGQVWRGERYAHLRPLQEQCEMLSKGGLTPGMVIIEAPMGEGKTEAAVYLAVNWLAGWKLSGFYIGLPTAATSNQMYDRIRAFLESHEQWAADGIRLVHGTAWLMDESTPLAAPQLADTSEVELRSALDWFRPKKRSLLAPYAVGTVDQAMLAALHVKHGFLRLFGLTGKVLIIDEVHAYDTYMSKIIDRLMEWCASLRIPVIMLSATLPSRRRKELIKAYSGGWEDEGQSPATEVISPYPLITVVNRDAAEELVIKPSTRKADISLDMHSGSLNCADAAATAVLARLDNGGCFCVIANTVRSAQRIYRCLQDGLDEDVELILFHSRYRIRNRRRIENNVLDRFDRRSLLNEADPDYRERPARAILIATQVVEQSLDVDFDEMFTAIAPVDLLLQRAGRLHRHSERKRPTGNKPKLHILLPEKCEVPDFGASEKVYDRYILLKTYAWLAGKNSLRLPDEIRPAVEAVYGGDPGLADGSGLSNTDALGAYQKHQLEMEEESQLAQGYLIPSPAKNVFKLARVGTAFEEDEEKPADYFNARARLGDDSQTILIMETGDKRQACLADKRPPDRDTLKSLYLDTATLPRWWFAGTIPAEGYGLVKPGPTWLPGTAVLHMRDGIWRGSGESGGDRVIREDKELGFVMEEQRGC